MNVTVTDNKMGTITYGYSPEHFASVVEFYSGLVQDGSIYTYTVKMQCVGLDIPPKNGRPPVDNLWKLFYDFTACRFDFPNGKCYSQL